MNVSPEEHPARVSAAKPAMRPRPATRAPLRFGPVDDTASSMVIRTPLFAPLRTRRTVLGTLSTFCQSAVVLAPKNRIASITVVAPAIRPSVARSATVANMTRHVVVTGANRGIGRAIAEAFVAAGDHVSTIYRGGELPDGVDGAIADITDSTAVNAAFDDLEAKHGRVRVLVANAGITKDGLLMRMSDEDFEQVIDVNLTGTFRTVRRAVQSMMREKYGRIVLVGSVVGLLGNPGQVNYSSSKSALVGMARSITREVGSRGITANVIAPGFIETAMTAELGEDLTKQYQANIPARRFGSTEEVANAAVFLGSDAAGYISGAVLPVDGGLGMGH